MAGAAGAGTVGDKRSAPFHSHFPLETLGESRGFLVLVLWPMLYGQAVPLSGY